VAAVAGHLATKVMELASIRLYALDSQQAHAHDDATRPGPPDQLAAEQTTRRLGIRPQGAALERARMAPSTTGLRSAGAAACHPATHDHPASPPAHSARLVTGAAISLLLDQALTPALGLSAPTAPTHSSPTCAACSRTWASG